MTMYRHPDHASPIRQQQLEGIVGDHARLKLCVPASFYAALQSAGNHIDHEEYAKNLNWDDFSHETGWNRPAFSTQIRANYGASVVSWWTNHTGKQVHEQDLIKMAKAGYVQKPNEIEFLRTAIADSPDIFTLVETTGIPIIATVKPGFGHNLGRHAIILESYTSDTSTVRVFDPDERNERTHYEQSEVSAYIEPLGASSIILPKF